MIQFMIEREIAGHLASLFQQYPIVTVTGPRQSGKTTLCRQVFPELTHVNLEQPDRREFAETDPRGFLAQLGTGAIIDEVQRVPDLLSYLQVTVDEDGRNGLFVLTGSEQFGLREAVNQSLAGRTALLRLLPFSLSELQKTGANDGIDDVLFSGFYPRIHDQGLDPRQALGDYFETYVERDVSRLANLRELGSFRTFVRLCAGRIGQLLNVSSLGSDAGVTRQTARDWLNLLEASYIAFQLQPYHANIRKRMVKSSKLYFYDVGLASYLLGIQNADQIESHPLRGQLFENAVVVETLKYRFNRGLRPNLSFFRDSNGLECDVFYETGHGIGAIEVKAGATVASSYFGSLNKVADLVPEVNAKAVVYGGMERQSRTDAEVVPLNGLSAVLDRFELNRDISEFIRQRRGNLPVDRDIEILNNVFRSLIHPTIDGLDTVFAQLADGLFANSSRQSYIISGPIDVNSSSLFEPGNWENTKRGHIVKSGFRLSDERPLELRQLYRLGDYTGTGNTGFGVNMSISWILTQYDLLWEVNFDDPSLTGFTQRFPYSELDAKRNEVDQVVAKISKSLIDNIDSLSSG